MFKNDPAHIRRCTTQIERQRTRAAKIARQLPVDDHGLVELLDSCVSLSDALLRDLSGACLTNETLTRQLAHQARWWNEAFTQMPLACLEVGADGEILRANPSAGELFNISIRHLRGRQLLPFMQDRDGFALLLREVTSDRTRLHSGTCTIRPRERAPLDVEFRVLQPSEDSDEARLWFVIPTAAKRRPSSPGSRMMQGAAPA